MVSKHETSPADRWLNRTVIVGVGSVALILGYDLATEGPSQTAQNVVEFFSSGPGGELIKHMDNPLLDNEGVHPAASLVPVDVTNGPFKIVRG
jgi:hypothetical protein